MQFQYAGSNVNIVIPKGILELLCTGQKFCELQIWNFKSFLACIIPIPFQRLS